MLEVAASEILKLNRALSNTFLSQTWAEPISRTLFTDYLTTCKCTTALLYLAGGPIKRSFNIASALHRLPVFFFSCTRCELRGDRAPPREISAAGNEKFPITMWQIEEVVWEISMH